MVSELDNLKNSRRFEAVSNNNSASNRESFFIQTLAWFILVKKVSQNHMFFELLNCNSSIADFSLAD